MSRRCARTRNQNHSSGAPDATSRCAWKQTDLSPTGDVTLVYKYLLAVLLKYIFVNVSISWVGRCLKSVQFEITLWLWRCCLCLYGPLDQR